MYLPQEIEKAKVLVTVKAYPKPSGKYQELVCTAGLYEGGPWIRIYPVSYRFLTGDQQYPKYSWVTVDLVRNMKDFRPESYRPRLGLDEVFHNEGKLATKSAWAARKSYVLKEIFHSMTDLIDLAKSNECKSLATLKPMEITGFDIEQTSRDWKESWQNHLKQASFADLSSMGEAEQREIIDKVPFDYYYKFLAEGDHKPRRLKIEDWEIGALFWKCLRRADGDEDAANKLVRAKYLDEFVEKKDLYFFVGTTQQYHRIAPNPFMIIGVFYPPKSDQPLLFNASA